MQPLPVDYQTAKGMSIDEIAVLIAGNRNKIAENTTLRSENDWLRQSIERLNADKAHIQEMYDAALEKNVQYDLYSQRVNETLQFHTKERARWDDERNQLAKHIERLQAQIARMQAERWAPTIATEPGCDAEAEWQEHKG